MKNLPKIEDFEGLSYEDAAFMRADVESMIAAAVSAERERCAKIADDHQNSPEAENEWGHEAAYIIAAAIRAGNGGK